MDPFWIMITLGCVAILLALLLARRERGVTEAEDTGLAEAMLILFALFLFIWAVMIRVN